MVLVRRLVLNGLKHNILFQARHIPGLTNVLADHLLSSADSTVPSQFSHNNSVECHYNEDNFQDLLSIASDLIQQSLALSTHSTYQRAIEYYHRFVSSLTKRKNSCTAEDILFIAFCFSQDLACSTVTTYVSAFKFST